MEARVLSNILKRQISADPNNDQNVGSAREDSPESTSLSGLVSTLVPTLIIAIIYFIVFLVLRPKFPRQYAPRTYVGALQEQERTPSLPDKFLGWISTFRKIPDEYVLQHNSLDGYFLLRYLKISVLICFVGCCVTWPILFPLNATGGAGKEQLNILSMSNIDENNKSRLYAHAILAWLFLGFVIFLVTREMIYYINLRQAYLLSPLYASRISSRTVLFQSVPREYTDEGKIRRMFGPELKNVWIACESKELEEMVDERTKIALKLEGAETKLIKMANDARLKAVKAGNAPQSDMVMSEMEVGSASGAVAARWVEAKDRPIHRLKPLVGRKVDTINWSRGEIARLNPLIERLQNLHRSGEAQPKNAVFVEFHTQSQAQAAYQMVAHHQPLHMAPRIVGLHPGEVVWSNLGITWRTLTIRNIISIAVVVVTIIFWSIPVAFVGSVSQLSYLTTVFTWLEWVNSIPDEILGVITNLLPVIALALLMALLPPFLRFLAKFGGKPTMSAVELRTHESYFWFQVIQVFLVTTMTSAASAAVPQIINNPTSVTRLLAENLPYSSNFYISYFILQGLAFSSGALLQIVGLILFMVLSKLFDKTPRKMYTRWSSLSSLGWGTIFPLIELLAVISIAYSMIAPLMLGFSTLGLTLYYWAFRYNLLFVNTSDIDTKGLVYAKALQHTLVGCYLLAICLIGLFAIQAAPGPLILMVVFLIFMVLYHISLNAAVNPLLYYLPKTLESEEEALLQSEDGLVHPGPSTMDKDAIDNTKELARNRHAASVIPQPAGSKVSFIKKFLRPDIHCSYAIMRKLVPQDFADITYAPEVERDAYQHPAVTNVTPLLWIPRDEMGISRQECEHTNKVTPMTDDGAYFDEKGKIIWSEDETGGRAPIWEEKIYY